MTGLRKRKTCLIDASMFGTFGSWSPITFGHPHLDYHGNLFLPPACLSRFGNHVNQYSKCGDIAQSLSSRHQRSSRIDGMRNLAFKVPAQVFKCCGFRGGHFANHRVSVRRLGWTTFEGGGKIFTVSRCCFSSCPPHLFTLFPASAPSGAPAQLVSRSHAVLPQGLVPAGGARAQ